MKYVLVNKALHSHPVLYPIIYIFRDNSSQKVRFMPAPRSRSDLEHTCGLQSQPQRWSFNESSPNQWDQFVVEYLGEPGEHIYFRVNGPSQKFSLNMKK